MGERKLVCMHIYAGLLKNPKFRKNPWDFCIFGLIWIKSRILGFLDFSKNVATFPRRNAIYTAEVGRKWQATQFLALFE